MMKLREIIRDPQRTSLLYRYFLTGKKFKDLTKEFNLKREACRLVKRIFNASDEEGDFADYLNLELRIRDIKTRVLRGTFKGKTDLVEIRQKVQEKLGLPSKQYIFDAFYNSLKKRGHLFEQAVDKDEDLNIRKKLKNILEKMETIEQIARNKQEMLVRDLKETEEMRDFMLKRVEQ